jgi:hypothetical protein
MNTTTTETPAARSLPTPVLAPRRLLRLEGLALFAASIAGYFALGGSAGWFFGLFFLPDVGLLPYLASHRIKERSQVTADRHLRPFADVGMPSRSGATHVIGAFTYNLTHTTALALALGALGFALGSSPAMLGALIWLAHIGFDRALGYGLKHPDSFKDTHIQRA